ncbi:MAG: DNA cytosine methyltransferase, partial [Candidatus Methanomethylicaceae archaeon]
MFEVVDLFCAPGGLSLGFSMAGFRVVAGIDSDVDAMKTYRRNFPETRPILRDIRTLDPGGVMRYLEIEEGEIDVMVGGPPCQGFSTIGRPALASLARAGRRKDITVPYARFIDDPRNELYRYFMVFVKSFRPKFVVMENVLGMMSYRNGEIVRQIVGDFRRMGYRTEARVLNAVWFGVPQMRRRIFFIGTRLRDAEIRWPRPTHGESAGTGTTLEHFVDAGGGLKPPVTVWEAIGDLPDPVPGRPKLADCPIPYDRPPFCEYQRFMREWGGGSPDGKVHNHVARRHNER